MYKHIYVGNSCKTLIGMHKVRGQIHPSLLAHDLLSPLAYPMITHTPLVAGNFIIKLSNSQQVQLHAV